MKSNIKNIISQINLIKNAGMIDVPAFILQRFKQEMPKRINSKINLFIKSNSDLHLESKLKDATSFSDIYFEMNSKEDLQDWKYKEYWVNDLHVSLNVVFAGLKSDVDSLSAANFTHEYDPKENLLDCQIVINVPTITVEDVQDPIPLYKEIYSLFHHELTHFAQTLLYKIKNNDHGKYYGNWNKKTIDLNNHTQNSLELVEEHSLMDIEFYPNIITQINNFENYIKTNDKSLDENLKEFIGIHDVPKSPFFAALKKHNKEKYKKAIKEFYKLYSNQE